MSEKRPSGVTEEEAKRQKRSLAQQLQDSIQWCANRYGTVPRWSPKEFEKSEGSAIVDSWDFDLFQQSLVNTTYYCVAQCWWSFYSTSNEEESFQEVLTEG